MREWLKANGGPPAVIVTGTSLAFAYQPLGVVLIFLGILMWLYAASWFPWKVVRKSALIRDDDRLLGQRCIELSEQILAWWAERHRSDPWGENVSEVDREKAWLVEDRYRRETEARFAEKYGGEAVALLRACVGRGITTNEALWPISLNGGMSHIGAGDVQKVGQLLAECGHELSGLTLLK